MSARFMAVVLNRIQLSGPAPSTAAVRSLFRSSNVRLTNSPVVPQTKTPCTPASVINWVSRVYSP